jgi:hypothetical protein
VSALHESLDQGWLSGPDKYHLLRKIKFVYRAMTVFAKSVIT